LLAIHRHRPAVGWPCRPAFAIVPKNIGAQHLKNEDLKNEKMLRYPIFSLARHALCGKGS
jgi:hypothetical protein